MKLFNPAAKGYLMILLSAIGFGSYGIWSRLIGSDFGVFYQGWVRSALVLLVLIPIIFVTRSYKKVDKKDRKWILIPILFGTVTQAPLYYAFNNMDIGTATLVFYALFVITSYLIGVIFLQEHITKAKLLSLALAFVGLLLVFGVSVASFSLAALLLAALNGIASGGEVSTTKKSTQKYSSLQIGMYIWIGILVTHLPLSLFLGEKQVIPEFNFVWFSMISFAFVGLFAFWLVVEGFKYADASIGSLIGLLEILFGVFFGILFFHEHLTPGIIAGGVLIILAGMLPDLITIVQKRTKIEFLK